MHVSYLFALNLCVYDCHNFAYHDFIRWYWIWHLLDASEMGYDSGCSLSHPSQCHLLQWSSCIMIDTCPSNVHLKCVLLIPWQIYSQPSAWADQGYNRLRAIYAFNVTKSPLICLPCKNAFMYWVLDNEYTAAVSKKDRLSGPTQ